MCNKLKCTRCHYELKGTENYCPICGLNLKGGMSKEEVIGQIDSLINEAELHIESDTFDCEVFRNDKEALETVKAVYETFTDSVEITIESFTTDELVKEVEKREGALTLKKEGSANFPKIDNMFLKFNALQCWYEKFKAKENQSFNGLCNLLKDIKEDYKKINNFYTKGAVG